MSCVCWHVVVPSEREWPTHAFFCLTTTSQHMKRLFTILALCIMSLSLNAQSRELLDFGKIVMGTAFKEGTVYYEGEKTPERFMSYLLIGEKKIFITSEHFDKRLEIPYDVQTDKDNAYTFLSTKTLEGVTINLDKGEVFYVKYIDNKDEAQVILTADIDMVKSLALLEVLKN